MEVPREVWSFALGQVCKSVCGRVNDSAILNDAVDASLVVPAGDARAEAELRFTDPDIENSEVLKIVLDLIMKGTMTLKSVNYPKCRRMCCAAAFLRKYECEAGLSTMKLVATNQLLLGGSVVPFYIFMLAAATDNVELSILCFKHRCLYEATDKAVAWHAVPGVDQIEFIQDLLGLTPTISLVDSLWPQALWAEIPFDYMWAANKAWGKALLFAHEACTRAKTLPELTTSGASFTHMFRRWTSQRNMKSPSSRSRR